MGNIYLSILALAVAALLTIINAPEDTALLRLPASLPERVRKADVNRVDQVAIAAAQREVRLQHARELMGKHYRQSEVRSGEQIHRINSKIRAWTWERLPAKYKKDSRRIARAIIDQSLRYEFDPVFLLSIIQGESSFNPDTIGGVGEIGLMQIRPETAEWVTKKFGIRYRGVSQLKDPVVNIRIGAAYLNYLRDRFDGHAQLYLAAYNMGQGNVDRALERSIWPRDYPWRIMKHYVAFYSDLSPIDRSVAKDRESAKPLKAPKPRQPRGPASVALN